MLFYGKWQQSDPAGLSLLQQSVIKQMPLWLAELVLPHLLCVCVWVLGAKYSASGADTLWLGAKTLRGLTDFFPPALCSSEAPKLCDSNCFPAASLPSNLEGVCSCLWGATLAVTRGFWEKGLFQLDTQTRQAAVIFHALCFKGVLQTLRKFLSPGNF